MIIVEGIDGTGKTTFIEILSEYGYERFHFDYDAKNQDLMTKYLYVLNNAKNKTALDRSFISELVYGPVMRNFSKLDLEQLRYLLTEYNKSGFNLVYLTASKDSLLERRKEDPKDLEMISNYYDRLSEQYENIITICGEHLPVHKFDTDILTINEMGECAKRKIKL